MAARSVCLGNANLGVYQCCWKCSIPDSDPEPGCADQGWAVRPGHNDSWRSDRHADTAVALYTSFSCQHGLREPGGQNTPALRLSTQLNLSLWHRQEPAPPFRHFPSAVHAQRRLSLTSGWTGKHDGWLGAPAHSHLTPPPPQPRGHLDAASAACVLLSMRTLRAADRQVGCAILRALGLLPRRLALGRDLEPEKE
jgi:hypothetical protein